MKKNNNDNLPQLIVALDGIGEDANYIHILDAKDDVEYFCPCCHGKVLPRAYKKDKDYEVQPHFYHDSGGCSNESYLHFICKNWLMVPGCKFIVEDAEYEVESADVEKTLKTDAGIYKPDIIVNSTSGKTFYFEIRVTNKKKIDTIRKWDELGNDVVEVDVRYFANQKYKNEIPIFNLIYSDGRCFIQEYIPKNYSDVIGVRKLHWKRQDRINYKIQWERLDWFWQCLSDFDGINKDNVLAAYKSLDYKDMDWCYFNIQGKSCVVLKNDFRDILTMETIGEICAMKYDGDEKVCAIVSRKSALTYEVKIAVICNYSSYVMKNIDCIKIKCIKGALCLQHIQDIKSKVNSLCYKTHSEINTLRSTINRIANLSYVKSVSPLSSLTDQYESIELVPFKVIFQSKILEDKCEEIGELTIYPLDDVFDLIHKRYDFLLKEAKRKCLLNQIRENLRNDAIIYKWLFWADNNNFKVRKNDLIFSLIENPCLCVASYEFDENNHSSEIMDNVFNSAIRHRTDYEKILDEYMNQVNSCKNKMWGIYNRSIEYSGDKFILCLKYDLTEYVKVIHIKYKSNIKDSEIYIKNCLKQEMLQMIRDNLGQVLPV